MPTLSEALVYLNGEFSPLGEAKISVMDRGFLLGDAVYEVIPVFSGVPFRLAHHLNRLNNSLKAIKIPEPLEQKSWISIIEKLCAQFTDENQSIYLQVTRGISPTRDHVFPQDAKPTVFIMAKPVDMDTLPDPYQGVSAITIDDIRWRYCYIKATTLLANVLAKQSALEQDASEAILIRDGNALEGAASNLFIVKDNNIITPPKSENLLPGITRDVILELANNHDLVVTESNISLDELGNADEIWLTSSVKEVVPVVTLDNQPVADGHPGEQWKKMKLLYEDFKKSLSPQPSH